MTDKEAQDVAPQKGGDGLGPAWKLWRRRRFVLASLAFCGLISMYTTRINFTVAVVAMTSGSGVCQPDARNASAMQPPVSDEANAAVAVAEAECEAGEFAWDSRTQGLLLSGFFYGYLASQLPAGWLVARAGAAALLGAGIAGSALLALLGPPAARLGGAPLLFAARICQGLLQGVVFPCLNALWARWAPPLERSRLATTVASGTNIGTVIVLPLSGLLAAHVGWPSIFYVFGAVGLLWWAMWWAQSADSPERDRRITEQERRFIEDALGADTATAKVSFHPWKKFFTSPAYLGKVASHFCANWGLYTLITQMPMYLKDTRGFDLREAGFVSALPYVVMAVLLQVAGHTADWLERRKYINTTHVSPQAVPVRRLRAAGGLPAAEHMAAGRHGRRRLPHAGRRARGLRIRRHMREHFGSGAAARECVSRRQQHHCQLIGHPQSTADRLHRTQQEHIGVAPRVLHNVGDVPRGRRHLRHLRLGREATLGRGGHRAAGGGTCGGRQEAQGDRRGRPRQPRHRDRRRCVKALSDRPCPILRLLARQRHQIRPATSSPLIFYFC